MLINVLFCTDKKRFPDALSKTIPLWCATLNRARQILVQPDPSNSTVSQQEWDRQGALYTSPQAVGPSEHAEIAKSIDRWAQDLVVSCFFFFSDDNEDPDAFFCALTLGISLRELRTLRTT